MIVFGSMHLGPRKRIWKYKFNIYLSFSNTDFEVLDFDVVLDKKSSPQCLLGLSSHSYRHQQSCAYMFTLFLF